MPAILDVAIGTVFIFLLFSIVVTALNEIWLSLLDKRAAFLKAGLKELLVGGGASVTPTALLDHGLISSLSRWKYIEIQKEPGFFQQIIIAFLPRWLCEKLGWTLGTRGVPSYIPGKSFVLALLSLVQGRPLTSAPATPAAQNAPRPFKIAPVATREAALLEKARSAAAMAQLGAHTAIATAARLAAAADAARKTSAELHAAILELPEGSKLKSSLLALYAEAGGDLELFKANIENWFNECMDRVGGLYKRYAQQWLFGLALLLAVLCNVDSLRIITALSRDPALRASMVRQAEIYADAHPAATPPDAPAPPPAGLAAAAEAAPKATPAPSPSVSSTGQIEHFKSALADLGETGIPLGWHDGALQQLFSGWSRATAGAWISALAGWLLTALAASLGAPFWFDILNRFVDLRGVGRAPEEKDPTAPKKRATNVESYVESGDARKTQ